MQALRLEPRRQGQDMYSMRMFTSEPASSGAATDLLNFYPLLCLWYVGDRFYVV